LVRGINQKDALHKIDQRGRFRSIGQGGEELELDVVEGEAEATID